MYLSSSSKPDPILRALCKLPLIKSLLYCLRRAEVQWKFYTVNCFVLYKKILVFKEFLHEVFRFYN